MKKIRKMILIIVTFVFVIISNFNLVYASNTEEKLEENTNADTVKMIGLIIIGIVLLSIVFYFAYKMDVKDETRIRRNSSGDYINASKKYQRKPEDLNARYVNDKDGYDSDEEEPDLFKTTIQLVSDEEDYEEKGTSDETMMFNSNDIKDDNRFETRVINNEENEIDNNSSIEEVVNSNENDKADEDIDNMYNFKGNLKIYKNIVDTSMFDTENIKKDIKKKVDNEFDNDEDLNDIMGLIKEAGIKKFTKKTNKSSDIKHKPRRTFTKSKKNRDIIDKKLEEIRKNKNKPEHVFYKKKKIVEEKPKKVFTRVKNERRDISKSSSDILFDEMIENRAKEARNIVDEEFSKLTSNFEKQYDYSESVEELTQITEISQLPKRRRGRPTKEEAAARKALEAAIPKKRGRPKKVEQKRRGRPPKNMSK